MRVHSPLGRGFLTSAVKPGSEYPEGDMRRFDQRWQGANYDANVKAIGRLTELAESKGITVTRLAENVAAAEVTLSPADLDRVHEILPDGSFGSRYPVEHMPQW
jgi:aryl-alcohol dehydrogenase-like predicted oxidoreductase